MAATPHRTATVSCKTFREAGRQVPLPPPHPFPPPEREPEVCVTVAAARSVSLSPPLPPFTRSSLLSSPLAPTQQQVGVNLCFYPNPHLLLLTCARACLLLGSANARCCFLFLRGSNKCSVFLSQEALFAEYFLSPVFALLVYWLVSPCPRLMSSPPPLNFLMSCCSFSSSDDNIFFQKGKNIVFFPYFSHMMIFFVLD